MSAGRTAKSVSFSGGAKPGAAQPEPIKAVNANEISEITNERVSWQEEHTERFKLLPLVDPAQHKVRSLK